eukprot:4894543-Karenia_brevis.AAC.1
MAGSPAKGRTIEGIVTTHVDDLLMTGTALFIKRVRERLRKDYKVGSDLTDDVMFVGQRVRWALKGKTGEHIRVGQESKLEELQKIAFDKSLKDTITCTPESRCSHR